MKKEGYESREGIKPPTSASQPLNDLLCFYVLYEHGGVASWRVTHTPYNLDSAEGLISWITEREGEKPEHEDFFLKYWKRLET